MNEKLEVRALALAAALIVASSAQAAERYIVQFNDAARGHAALAEMGASVVRELEPQGAAAALIPDAAVEALSHHPAIAFIEPDAKRYPLSQTTPYGINLVQAPQVWSSATGANRKICVIDSGLYTGHEDLQHSNVSGYPSGWSTDRCGHGTHVVGTMAALDNTTGVVGVLHNGVSLYVVKVFGDDCSWAYASDLVDAANRCKTAGANVISMSLGGSFASRTEESAFAQLYSDGLLSIAAAGNGGNNRYSYPASYSSVISVAAVDSTKTRASFSQYNDQVELSAPGVGVLSSVPWKTATLTIGTDTFNGSGIEYANAAQASGQVVVGGKCLSPGAWTGKVVLCERGDISFYDKVMNVQSGGGVAAVIYNNAPEGFSGTLGTGNSSQIPAMSLSGNDGALAVQRAGATGTVDTTEQAPASGYEAWDGTSMATPHVSAVAALVWSYDTRWTNAQIRDALQRTAQDLGTPGRDNEYGYGLVQAEAALDYLTAGGTPPPPGSITLAVTAYKKKGVKKADLSWQGATSNTVDVRVNGAVSLAGTPNDGAETLSLGKGSGTYRFQVCEAGTTTCSNEVTVTY